MQPGFTDPGANWTKVNKRSGRIFDLMEPTSLILSVVSVANMGILGILVCMFGRMYAHTRAQLPLGMVVVACMLFLHNVIGALAYFSMDELFSHEIFPYMLGVGIAELAGLLIFLKITLD